MPTPIKVALITGAGVVIAAVIGIYPQIRGGRSDAESAVAGIVVEQDTDRGIGQATITVAGRTEQYVTEDSGNFRIDLPAGAPKRLRLHVSKTGFQPLDMSVQAPAENLVLPLHKT
jgi:hypothetical protein